MQLETMYQGINNSPQTTLTAEISAVETIIAVTDVAVFPPAPNLMTISTGKGAEVVRYNGISGLALTGCERGFGGTVAKQWPVETIVYRSYTERDHASFIENINRLNTGKQEVTQAFSGNYSDLTNIPTKFNPLPHAAVHGANGSDAITISKIQVSDFPEIVQSYVHIRYAPNSAPTQSEMSTIPNNYMGVYTGQSSAPPTDPTDYIWVKIKGEPGIQGEPGSQGMKGDKGDQGVQGVQGIQGEPGPSGLTTLMITLLSTGWTDLSQTCNIPGITASSLVFASPAPINHDIYVDTQIRCSEQQNGKLIFKCRTVPSANVSVNVGYR